jgi:hypothetical protein
LISLTDEERVSFAEYEDEGCDYESEAVAEEEDDDDEVDDEDFGGECLDYEGDEKVGEEKQSLAYDDGSQREQMIEHNHEHERTAEVSQAVDDIPSDSVLGASFDRESMPSPVREYRSDTIMSSPPLSSDVKDDQDFTIDEATSPSTFQQSAAVVSPARFFLPGDSSNGLLEENSNDWDFLEDDIHVPLVNVTEVTGLSATEVLSISCTKSHVVFFSKDCDRALSEVKYLARSSADLDERYETRLTDDQKLQSLLATQGNSFLGTALLKNTTICSINCLVGDKVFEWVRGAAMTGWVIKWPQASEKSGFASKKFLVLRDNILAYYQAPPYEFSFLGSEALKSQAADLENCLVLTAKSTVSISRMRLRTAIKVVTDDDTLYFRCPNANERTRWLLQLQLAIKNLAKNAVFTSKARVQCAWYHDSPFFRSVSADVLSITKRHDHLSDSTVTIRTPDLSTSSSGDEGQGSEMVEVFIYGAIFRLDYVAEEIDRALSEPIYVPRLLSKHSMDITTACGDRFQRNIVLDGGSSCVLNVLRVLSEHTVAVAGSHGLLGLIDLRTRAMQENSPMLDYAQNPNYELKSASDADSPVAEIKLKETSPVRCCRTDGTPVHSMSSTVNFVAVAEPVGAKTLFAAGDSQGVFSLWTLDENNCAVLEDCIDITALDPRVVDVASAANSSTATEFGSDKPSSPSSSSSALESIKTIVFSPDRTLVAVGTSSRLVLLSIQYNTEKYSLISWIQADGKYTENTGENTDVSNPVPRECSVYAVSFERSIRDIAQFDITVWKLTTAGDSGRSSKAPTPTSSPAKAIPPSPSASTGFFGRIFGTMTRAKSPIEDDGRVEGSDAPLKSNSILHRIAWGREDQQRMLSKMVAISTSSKGLE